jgi:cytochrome P450
VAHPGQDTFLVSDPALVRDAVARPQDFSSELVSLLHADPTGCPVVFPMAPPSDPIHVLATADPPVHTRHRDLLHPHLSRSAVLRYEPAIRHAIERLVAPLLTAGGGDVVDALCDPLPAATICVVTGLPQSDVERVLPLVARTALLLDGITDTNGMGQGAAGALELAGLIVDRLQAAIADPPDETVLFGVLVKAIAEDVITADEAMNIVMQLLNAGVETTSSHLATAIEVLARDAELQRSLRVRPDRIPAVLDEILRLDGPFQFHYRTASHDTELGETPIPVGSRVLLMWAAANCPERGVTERWPGDLDEVSPRPHFAFGRGLHFCIGAHLARLETRLAIEHLLAATSTFTLDPDEEPRRRPSVFLRRHSYLPLRMA